MDNHSSKIGAPCNAVSADKTYRVSKRQPQLRNACGMPETFTFVRGLLIMLMRR